MKEKKKYEMSTARIENLCNAIVEQVAEDYADAFMGMVIDGKDPKDTMHECETLFHSEWYGELTEVDGDWLAKNVKIRELDKAMIALERMLEEDGSIRFSIAKTKGKDGLSFNVPPRLKGEFFETMSYYLEELKKEKKELLEKD